MGHNHRLGEIWLTLDKRRIYSVSDFKGYQQIVTHETAGHDYFAAIDLARKDGMETAYHLHPTLFDSLNLSVSEMLSSDYPILRALGVADARCGRRRLNDMRDSIETEHELVQILHRTRISTS